MTLTDLVALVAGFAFALTLAATFNESYIARIKMSAPEANLLRVGEYVSRFNIALVAVVLARHFRTCATFRGLEWLIIINAMRSVHLRLMYADGMLPEHVLVCLPLAAMLFELTREHSLAWTWVERAGLGAALVTAIIDGIMTVTEANRNVPLITLRVAYLSIWATWWLVAFAVARVAVRGLSGLWTSWVDPPSEGMIPGRRE
jgi:hypothetical protein